MLAIALTVYSGDDPKRHGGCLDSIECTYVGVGWLPPGRCRWGV